MKRLLMAMATVGLLLPGAATAQSPPPNKPPTGQPGPPGRPPPGGQPGRPGTPPPAHGQPPRPPGYHPPGNHPPPAPRPPAHPAPRPPGYHPPGYHPPGYHHPPGYRPPAMHPGYRPLPPRGSQFWHRGHYYNRLRGPAFVYPHGWRYRQWQIGQRLPPLLLGPAYIYGGWAALGLQAPVAGYAWVRFGPDLLLVNQRTFDVEDVIYGVFF